MDALEYLKKLNEICDLHGKGEDCEDENCPLIGLCGAPIGTEEQGWSVKAVREFVFPPTYFEDRSVRFQEVEMSVKANVCSGCVHRLVCAHKRDFSEAQKATGDIRISADETGCWVKVSDMKWIDVAINCLNFKKDCPAESCRGEREREKVR